MAILFSSDFHGNNKDEFIEVSAKRLRNTYGENTYNTIKYHIILGDGGFPVQNDTWSCYKSLAYRRFPILCVIGNHEPILGMKDLHKLEEDIGIGETVLKT